MTDFHGLPCYQSNAEGLNLPCSTGGCEEGVGRVCEWRRPRRERIKRRLEPGFVTPFYNLEIPLLDQITKIDQKSNTPRRIFPQFLIQISSSQFREITPNVSSAHFLHDLHYIPSPRIDRYRRWPHVSSHILRQPCTQLISDFFDIGFDVFLKSCQISIW